jgi:ABC-type transporter Mla MlaB component
VVIDGSLTGADVPRLCDRVRVLLEGTDAELVVCDVGAVVHPNVCTVDALARLQLMARRLGRQVRLRHASSELQELLTFVGLSDVLPLSAGLPLGRRSWQTEEREQSRRVQEGVESDDPPA